MIIGTYEFHCDFLDDAIMPRFKSSTFRGAFGNALRDSVCKKKGKACRSCPLARECLYAMTFEGQSAQTDHGPGPTRIAPHPFLIEPPLSSATAFKAGVSFTFGLHLLGSTNKELPLFVRTLEAMGKNGIGKKIDGRRARFAITDIRHENRTIYDAETCGLCGGAAMRALDLMQPSCPDPEDPEEMTLTVYLRTPLRLKFENRLQSRIPFHLLARAMLRRISSVFAWYGEGEPALDYRGLVARAAEIETVSSDLHWVDWQRFSTGQAQRMTMGGLVGKMAYRGAIRDFLPLFDLARILHLGKQTTFGLGMIDYTWQDVGMEAASEATTGRDDRAQPVAIGM